MATRRSNVDWPQDVLIEILLKLPVKSLLRFECVSTTWYDLIKSPTFVSDHHSLTLISKRNSTDRRLLVRFADSDAYGHDNVFMRLLDDQTLLPYSALLPQLPQSYLNPNSLGFSVDNGLVCLTDPNKYDRITLWNPATRELRNLPQCLPKLIYGNIVGFGFGFDPISNDYKVIAMYKDYTRPSLRPCCNVYRMSTDSWRVMDKEEVEMLTNINGVPSWFIKASINGVYYWKVEVFTNKQQRHMYMSPPPDNEHEKLLAFHFRDETFRLIKLPPQLPPSRDGQGQGQGQGQGLLPFPNDDGRICFWGTKGASYEIWALNNDDDDDDYNWTKLLTIRHHSLVQVTNIFKVWSRESKVLVKSKDGKLLLWHIDANKIRDTGIKTKPTWLGALIEVYPYQESLVAVRN